MSVEVIAFPRMDSSLAQSSDSEVTSPSRIKQLKAAFEQASCGSNHVKQHTPANEANNNNTQEKDVTKNVPLPKTIQPNDRKFLSLEVEKALRAQQETESKRITLSDAKKLQNAGSSPTPVPVPRVKSPKSNHSLHQSSNATEGEATALATTAVPRPISPTATSQHESISSNVSTPPNFAKPRPPRLGNKNFISCDNSSASTSPKPLRPSTPPMRKTSSEKTQHASVKPGQPSNSLSKPPLPQKSFEILSPSSEITDGSEWKRAVGPPARPVPPSPHSPSNLERESRRLPPTPPREEKASPSQNDAAESVTLSNSGSGKRRPPPRPTASRSNSSTSKVVKPPVPPTLRPRQTIERSSPLLRQKGVSKRLDRSRKPLPRQRHLSVTDERSLAREASSVDGRLSPLESFDASPEVTSIDDFINSVKRKYKKCHANPRLEDGRVHDIFAEEPEPILEAEESDHLDRVYEPVNGRLRSNTSNSEGADDDTGTDSGGSLYWTVDEPTVQLNTETPPLPPLRRTSLQRENGGRNSLTAPGCEESDLSSSEESEYEQCSLVERGGTLGVFTPEAYMALSEIAEEDSTTNGLYDVADMEIVAGLTNTNGQDDDYSDEPLYQVYAADILYEARKLSQKSCDEESQLSEYSTNSQGSGQRILWCQLPSVRVSGLLDNLNSEERKRQEAMFEVVTSEASYLKSLCVLANHFMMAPEFIPNSSVAPEDQVLGRQQFHFLFTGVTAVKAISEKLLHDLRMRQEQGVVITSISDIILEYASKHFACYIKYCSNQIFQDRTLMTIVQENPRFCEVLGRLESSPKCQGLSMQSFMMLPMQRITRMPLLLDAICSHCEPGSDEFHLSDRALRAVNKVVKECNEGARRMERTEQMYFIQQAISFKTKPIPLISSSRWLLRRGPLSCLHDDNKVGKHRRPLRQLLKGRPKPIYIFLFTDLLLLAKVKSDDNYKVFDYCSRSMLRVEDEVDNSATSPEEIPGGRSPSLGSERYLFNLILLENSKGKTVDYLCLAQNETEKTRWLEALSPTQVQPQDGETIYSEWDCPQVQAVHSYQAQQPDELNLQEGDVIKVLRKLADGWFEGQRLRDGEEGWFPANHTEEILSEHVRARNLLQRYRLIHASKVLVDMMQKQDS